LDVFNRLCPEWQAWYGGGHALCACHHDHAQDKRERDVEKIRIHDVTNLMIMLKTGGREVR